MTISIRFWLHVLLWLVFGFALLSAGIIAVKERLRERLTITSFGGGLRRTFLVVTGERVSRQAIKLFFLAFGCLIGYGFRDAMLLQRTQTLASLTVLERYDDFHFRMLTERGQAFNVAFCADSLVDFSPGDKLKVLNYEQKRGCKSLVGRNLGFLKEVANGRQ